VVARPAVVDYDALSWSLPIIAQAAGGGSACTSQCCSDSCSGSGSAAAEGQDSDHGHASSEITVTDESALYATYLQALRQAGAAAAATPSIPSGASAAATAPAPPVVYHAVDSDTDSDDDPLAGVRATGMGLAMGDDELGDSGDNDCDGTGDGASKKSLLEADGSPTPAAAGAATQEAGRQGRPTPPHPAELTAARRAALQLGVRLADPLHAYVYILRRRR
jgi:hypothetical protein